MSTTILIVEDHAAIRESLRDWLSAAFPDCELQDVASGEEAVTLVDRQPPSIVLMDIGLAQMDGIEATRCITHRAPQTQVVILTGYEANDYRSSALAAGAVAYVPKHRMHTQLLPLLSRLLAHLPTTDRP
jgi:NarL family two-component system response regulator LiaR